MEPTAASINESEINTAHQKAEAFAQRLKNDPAARAVFQQAPLETLTGEGLPEPAARELLTKLASARPGEADVSGYEHYLDTDVYQWSMYLYTKRQWFDDMGSFLYEQILYVPGHTGL